MMEKKIGKAQP